MDNIRNIVSRLRENRLLQEKEDYSKYSRDDLIDLAQSGDQLAMEILLKNHDNLIRMIARKYFTKGGDQDDLYQVGSVGFWQAVMDWNGEGNFEAFAGMYIKRAIMKELDKDNANKSKINHDADSLDAKVSGSGEDDRTLGDVIPDNTASLEDEVASREMYHEVLKFLSDNFSDQELKVIRLAAQGYKAKEISEELDMKYKSVDNILYKIRYALKNKFKESKTIDEDMEFSEKEKKILLRALDRIERDKSLDESTISEVSNNYENYTEIQLDKALDSIEYELDTIRRDTSDGVDDGDLLSEYSERLEDIRYKLLGMEEWLTDEQYKRSESLLDDAYDLEYNMTYTGKPRDHYAEIGMSPRDFM